MSGQVAGPTSGRLNQEIANAIVRRRKALLGRGPTRTQAFYRDRLVVVLMEDALTDVERRLAGDGGLDAVLGMRLRYQRRREALMDALGRHLPQAKVEEGAAGLYELAKLPDGIDEADLVSAAAGRGVGVEGLALHRFRPGGPPGLVLGFAGLPEPAIEQSVRLLAEAFAEVKR